MAPCLTAIGPQQLLTVVLRTDVCIRNAAIPDETATHDHRQSTPAKASLAWNGICRTPMDQFGKLVPLEAGR